MQMAASKTQADGTNKIVDGLVTKVHQIDDTVHDQDTGLLNENANLKEEIRYLMKTCKDYEDRFVEMENEVQVITFPMRQ